MHIPGEDMHFQWRCALLVSHIHIPGEAHPHSRWSTSSFPVRMSISGEAYPHSWWRCFILGESHPHFTARLILFSARMNHKGINILTGNGNVAHRECIPSLGMRMWLTRNAHPHRDNWSCLVISWHKREHWIYSLSQYDWNLKISWRHTVLL